MTTLTAPGALPPWTPPDPRELPEWRGTLVEYHQSEQAEVATAWVISSGHWTVCPQMPASEYSMASIGAHALSRQAASILEEAALYFVTADMTSLALAAAETPPAEPMALSRLPSESGLIVFAEPIGGYTRDAAQALAGTPAYEAGASTLVTTPIVAASWTTWSPGLLRFDDAPPLQWLHKTSADGVREIPQDFHGIWVTWYAPGSPFAQMDPSTVIGKMRDGSEMTAGRITRDRTLRPPLQWDNETVVREGAAFGPVVPDTTNQWMNVLYTAWQLMGQQERSQLAEVEEVPRQRAGQKRDRRQGITDPGTVRIVHVHSAHRPSPTAAAQDAAASTGRRAPQWSCRWPVRPHRRDHCMDPRRHADGACTHEDRIIPPYIKGPAGKPLRIQETVNVWDSQPGEGSSR